MQDIVWILYAVHKCKFPIDVNENLRTWVQDVTEETIGVFESVNDAENYIKSRMLQECVFSEENGFRNLVLRPHYINSGVVPLYTEFNNMEKYYNKNGSEINNTEWVA